MRVINSKAELRPVIESLEAEGKHIGFVPTMGALHEGHLSLVRLARERADAVVASVFVNPTQFGPHEDFSRYPRDLERDAALLDALGVDVLFAPPPEEIYPPQFKTYVQVEELDARLEGASRPGHFRGVATVLAVLFNLVRPQFVVMGQKDAQQVAVVRQMVGDLQFPLEVVAAPIVREADGLAMSSRNQYLTAEERRAAPVLSRALRLAEELFARGERDAHALVAAVRDEIAKEPLARVDYVALTDAEELEPLDAVGPRPALLSLAARFGSTRLIDNIVLVECGASGR
jgi:pantoate--beta-alanine ligase